MNYKVLSHDYLSVDDYMVSVFKVQLPDNDSTVYAFLNSEGCALSTVDYVRDTTQRGNRAEKTILMIEDYNNYTNVNGLACYALIRHCLFEHLRVACQLDMCMYGLPYEWLPDEIKSQITDEERRYVVEELQSLFYSDGYEVTFHSSPTVIRRLPIALR